MIRSIKTCQKTFEKDIKKTEDQVNYKDLFTPKAMLLTDYTHL